MGIAAFATSACGDDDHPDPGGLPAISASASPDAEADAEADVEAAYRGYQKASEEMASSGDPDPARLRPYATPEVAQQKAETLATLFGEDYRIIGSATIDVRSVTVTGEKAVLEACVDATKWVTVTTGEQPEPGAKGADPGLARVQMVQQDDRWLVADTTDAGEC